MAQICARESDRPEIPATARGAILIAASRDQARDWANRLAPEHITVAEEDLPFIQNAGSVFVGDYSAQAAGDYASGPNHVLPTSGQARFRGGLSVLDFVKVITVQKLSAAGLRRIAPAIECLAEAEGLTAHAQSVSREVRTCLSHGKRCGRCLRTIRRWRGADGLRLDFNENTVGCSPRVLERLRQIGSRATGTLSGARAGGSSGRGHAGNRSGGAAADEWRGRSDPPAL